MARMMSLTMTFSNPEMGRELLASELVVKTVVIVGREDRPHCFTVWVWKVDELFVAFRAGEIGNVFIAFRRDDGTLMDDTGQRIRVWEYLGEV
jgi:hypothetical protein